MMLITPAPMFLGSGGIVFPAVTVGRADIGGLGAFYGYVRSGGSMASQLGVSGGTLSGTLVPGFVTDAVVDITGGGTSLLIVIMGNCAALLSGVTAIMDNGTPLSFSYPAAYDAGSDTTATETAGGWSATGNRTVQLVTT